MIGAGRALRGARTPFRASLSGGQQQRVGIARSLAVEPELWFLDEPFSALDPLIRREMQDEFLRLQSVLKKTIVFITHDFDEAIRLADRIAIMKDGAVGAGGTPEELVLNPATDYVREFTRAVAQAKVVRLRASLRPASGPVPDGLPCRRARDGGRGGAACSATGPTAVGGDGRDGRADRARCAATTVIDLMLGGECVTGRCAVPPARPLRPGRWSGRRRSSLSAAIWLWGEAAAALGLRLSARHGACPAARWIGGFVNWLTERGGHRPLHLLRPHALSRRGDRRALPDRARPAVRRASDRQGSAVQILPPLSGSRSSGSWRCWASAPAACRPGAADGGAASCSSRSSASGTARW